MQPIKPAKYTKDMPSLLVCEGLEDASNNGVFPESLEHSRGCGHGALCGIAVQAGHSGRRATNLSEHLVQGLELTVGSHDGHGQVLGRGIRTLL